MPKSWVKSAPLVSALELLLWQRGCGPAGLSLEQLSSLAAIKGWLGPAEPGVLRSNSGKRLQRHRWSQASRLAQAVPQGLRIADEEGEPSIQVSWANPVAVSVSEEHTRLVQYPGKVFQLSEEQKGCSKT